MTVEGGSLLEMTRRSVEGAAMAGVNDWEHRMQLNFLPARRWMISLHNELYHSSEKDFGVNWFCDASLSYKADRWEVSLVGRNLAGISRYIEDKSAQYGYTVLFCSSDENAEKLASVIDTVLAYNIDGLIVAPVPGGQEAISKAIDARVPVVLLDRDIEGLDGVGKVLLNDVEAGDMATEFLISNGYRKIEMISYDLDISSISERAEGYRRTMAAHGLESHVNTTTYGDPQKLMPNIIKDALERGVEAFFLPTYSLTALAFGAMNELNLSTPRDIGIVAFDESDLYRLGASTIAHIVQPLRELGEKSFEVLHAMIENEPCERNIILKPELVPGGSVIKKA